ncbi:MAG: sulfite exporter TauE/SafE family protein [Parachlamydiaceae bacterium]|nr:sulfite exporter TauE/SafE family protein [Parachlamydiaceae bacterium]
MALFFTLLPLYLLGNIHCLGMCGPLVMMIGQHRFRYFYFLGRLISFGLAGFIAGEAGAVLHIFLKQYHIAEATSFIFGGIIFFIGLSLLCGWQIFSFKFLSGPLNNVNKTLSSLMLKDKGWSTFLFGFFTVFLPCGQTLVVFSACALSGDPYVGLLNGSALALLTSPSLFLAMHTHTLFKKFKKYYNTALGTCSIIIGLLAFARGFAELGLIPHLIINPEAPSYYHIVIY